VSCRDVSKALANAEEERESSFANSTWSLSVASSRMRNSFMCFFGDEGFSSRRRCLRISLPGVRLWQAVAVGGHHGDRLGL